MSLIEKLPTKVKVDLELAIGGLSNMHDALESGRRADNMFSGGGRYEADVIENKWGTTQNFFDWKEFYLDIIEKWRARCPSDINFDELIEEFGGVTKVYLTAGYEYLNEKQGIPMVNGIPLPAPLN